MNDSTNDHGYWSTIPTHEHKALKDQVESLTNEVNDLKSHNEELKNQKDAEAAQRILERDALRTAFNNFSNDVVHFFRSYAEDDTDTDEYTIKLEDINEFLKSHSLDPIEVEREYEVTINGEFEYVTTVTAKNEKEALESATDELDSVHIEGDFSWSRLDDSVELA